MTKKLPDAAAIVAAFLLITCAVIAHAQESPVGTWDFSVSGLVKGNAYLTFTGGGAINGYLAVAQNPNEKVPADVETVVFGYFSVSGEWHFDEKGRVVGFFGSGETEDGVEFNVNFFSASVRSGVKMTMRAQSNDAELGFRGVPAVALPDLSADWLAKVSKGKKGEKAEVFLETLTLAPSGTLNVFDLDGDGVDFHVCGFVLLSQPNRIVLVSRHIPAEEYAGACEGGVVRSLTGKFNFAKGKTTLSGSDDDDLQIRMAVTVE